MGGCLWHGHTSAYSVRVHLGMLPAVEHTPLCAPHALQQQPPMLHAWVQLGMLPLAIVHELLYTQLPVPCTNGTSTVIKSTQMSATMSPELYHTIIFQWRMLHLLCPFTASLMAWLPCPQNQEWRERGSQDSSSAATHHCRSSC